MIAVPPEFAQWRVRTGGAAARLWLERLPAIVGELCARWRLEIDDPTALHGGLGLVVLVRRGVQPCVLKLSWQEDKDGLADEILALQTWNGNGSMMLYEASPAFGALLLERLDPDRCLHSVDVWQAAGIAGALLHRLAVPCPPGLPALPNMAHGIAARLPQRNADLGHPVPAAWLDRACQLSRELASRPAGRLVHADLHYGNILAGERQPWLAVDPRPVDGDPAYSVPELMWTRADDLATQRDVRRLLAILVESAELDPDAAHGWTIVRCVDYWLWGLRHGLTIDPARCERVLGALV